MRVANNLNSLPLWARRIPVRIISVLNILRFQLRSLSRGRFVWSDEKPVISIATYGHREKWLHLTIESMLRSGISSGQIYVWLDDPFGRNLPRGLRRLHRQGVSVQFLPSEHRSHKKWVGPARNPDLFYRGCIIADDDFFYPKNWLRRLQEEIARDAAGVHVWRCKTIAFDSDGQLKSYKNWKLGGSNGSLARRNFATLGAGSFLPKSLILALAVDLSKNIHLELAPTADDVWINLILLRTGLTVNPLTLDYVNWPQNPLQGKSGLASVNLGEGLNDAAISNCFDSKDISKILSSN